MIIKQNSVVNSDEINSLMSLCWNDHENVNYQSILDKSLAYITVREDSKLIGFYNLAWDGGRHATVFDLNVHPDYRHQGIALKMLELAPIIAKKNNIKFLHVDFDLKLEKLYKKAGFEIISAGIIKL